ncbi:hypothetical protein SAMN04488057_104217 [Cyclobacterium lianum]|uniref:Uncharacterized protein n=1 Tax=Cyclobacterium lianum TaxID=388280 RepID=A0A1M7MC31_9BACT|nr:hypothetical protein [Cyclobacterium lianum]SHM88370.1 hypothetical protein SAMN04488057_104217 [Cyclobacterium lianum]
MGETLTASPDNIKKDITKKVSEIRYGANLSPKRIDQLRNVKAIFNQAKLGSKASEIDRLIDAMESPRVGLKNGVEYH